MKKYYLPFLFILMLSACKKDDTTAPDDSFDPPTTPVAVYTLTDNAGNCNNANIQGTYAFGSALSSSVNRVVLQVNVTAVGSYGITTITVNGYKFATSGVFSTTGNQTITLVAVGTPVSAGTDYFPVSNGNSNCGFSITVVDASLVDNDHMYFGNPSNAKATADSAGNYLMRKSFYALSYSKDRGIANWVSWHLFSNDLGSTPRQDDFRADNTLPSGWYQVTDNDYSSSGFDRGHNAPSADRTNTVAANSSTFLMTNMIPQAPYHNQIVWNYLEDSLRQLVTLGNELYIIMGSYGSGGTGLNGFATSISGGKVTVPASIYKIAIVIPDGSADSSRVSAGTRVIAVNIPNTNTLNTSLTWKDYRVSVDAIEAITGYDFLSRLPIPLQAGIESQVDNL